MIGLQHLRGLLTPAQHRAAVGLLVLMAVGMLLETLGVGLIVPAMSYLVKGTYALSVIATGLVALVVVYLGKAAFLTFLARRQAGFAFDVQADVSKRLFAAYLSRPYEFHLQQNSALLIRNVIGQVNLLTFDALLPAMVVMTELLVAAGLAVLLFFLEPVGTFLIFALLALSAWAFHSSTGPRHSRWGAEYHVQEGVRLQHLQQGLGAVKEIKVLGCEQAFADVYDEHNRRSARAAQLQTTWQQMPRLWLEVLAVVALVGLVLSMLLRGRPIDEMVPTLAVFAAAAFRLLPSANRVLTALQSLRYSESIVAALDMELRAQAPASPGEPEPMVLREAVEIDRVMYVYPGMDKPALGDVSLRIDRGTTIAIIGPSGSGKSTLVDILLGLLVPHRGTVRVDGIDVAAHARAWQRSVGYVPQSIYLTDDSIRRNIAFGVHEVDIDETALRRAVTAAQLSAFVASLPKGIDTLVGERGVRLSGGQRQRVGIARALYRQPSLLVLDEATSGLDPETEREVMNAIDSLHGSCTVVIVGHRLSAAAQCDRIYRMQQGIIIEEQVDAARAAGP